MVCRLELVIANTNFTITIYDHTLDSVIDKLIERSTTYKRLPVNNFKGKKFKGPIMFKMVVDRFFYNHRKTAKNFSFSINDLQACLQILAGSNVKKEEIAVRYDRFYAFEKLNCVFKEHHKPKDYQEQYTDAITEQNAVTRLVDLFTGYGKTFIAMYSLSRLNMRVMILVLPKYMDKWISDVKHYYHITDEQINIIQGSESLIEAMNADDYNYPFTICSMRTMSNYVTSYEDNENIGYTVAPNELLRKLKIGVLLNDESHQEFHALFKAALYLNPIKFIGLTATIETKDKYAERMYRTLFPMEQRISGIVKYKRYVDVYGISYTITSLKRLQWKRAQGYNHILFEQSIMKSILLLTDYVNMILYYLENGHLNRKVKGDKCLIFVASVDLCTILVNWIKNKYPHLNVTRYVENDSYDNIINPDVDITVSTVGSSGTALDIPNLITVIQTISISSIQANRQAFGRLRDIPGKEMRYYYVFCKDIKEHRNHNRDRIDALSDRANKIYRLEHIAKLNNRG